MTYERKNTNLKIDVEKTKISESLTSPLAAKEIKLIDPTTTLEDEAFPTPTNTSKIRRGSRKTGDSADLP